MRAILVCVDFADLLSVTLPYNRHHFSEVTVVTTPQDEETQRVARQHASSAVLTESFYDNGALFNKWLALEEGLDVMGREGWICIMDCDVLWPESLQFREQHGAIDWWHAAGGTVHQDRGQLATPKRRMAAHWVASDGVVGESIWKWFPLHPQQQEFAGYTQVFHADDLHLGSPPWHQTDWRHAGGADSFFQAKWSNSCKVRPPFEVLHLGPSGVNWGGRADRFPDRAAEVGRLIAQRRGRSGPERFAAERLG